MPGRLDKYKGRYVVSASGSIYSTSKYAAKSKPLQLMGGIAEEPAEEQDTVEERIEETEGPTCGTEPFGPLDEKQSWFVDKHLSYATPSFNDILSLQSLAEHLERRCNVTETNMTIAVVEHEHVPQQGWLLEQGYYDGKRHRIDIMTTLPVGTVIAQLYYSKHRFKEGRWMFVALKSWKTRLQLLEW